jgi:hypothetical protein
MMTTLFPQHIQVKAHKMVGSNMNASEKCGIPIFTAIERGKRMEVTQNGGPPKSSILNRNLHYKPTILGPYMRHPGTFG